MSLDVHSRDCSLVEARAGVVERLRSRRDELEEAIFARFNEDLLSSSGAEDAEYVTGLRVTIAAAVGYGLQSIAEGGEWSGAIPVEVVAQARRAAGVGVSLDTVLRRYVVGHTLLEGFVMEEADHNDFSGQRGAVRDVLREQASLLDRLLAAITSEYGDELKRATRSPEARRAERVQALLAGSTVDTAVLDYDLDDWHL